MDKDFVHNLLLQMAECVKEFDKETFETSLKKGEMIFKHYDTHKVVTFRVSIETDYVP